MTIDEAIKLTHNEKLQLFLMDFEEALFKRCPKCGQLVKKNWSPQEWADRLEVFLSEETKE